MIDWAREIRRYRESNGLLQGDLGGKLGVSQATVSRWEAGRQRPDVESQALLRPLLWRGLIDSEALLLTAVAAAPTFTAIGDREGRLLAASRPFAEVARLHPKPGARVAYDMAAMSPDSWQAFQAARKAGLFDGHLAYVTLRSRVATPEGPAISDEIWCPLRLNSGEIVVRADMTLEFLEAVADPDRPSGMASLRMVRMEDLLVG